MTMAAVQPTITVAIDAGTTPSYIVAGSIVNTPDSDEEMLTTTVTAGQRWLRRNDGMSVEALGEAVYVTPGGSSRVTTGPVRQTALWLYTLSHTFTSSLATVGAVVGETVYVADFEDTECRNDSFTTTPIAGTESNSRGYQFTCQGVDMTVVMTLAMTTMTSVIDMPVTMVTDGPHATVTVHRTEGELLGVCWRDYRDVLKCNKPQSANGTVIIALAFPDQTYRRDNGECQSAPFFAVGNCQNENAVDVGNFAAFVSGLNGNGYRQFGVRHRFDGEGWNAAAMVSHAKGAEFLDTWWGRLRFEHSIIGDASAFAEYESGITSLQQRGVMFADIPISGGRVGFRFADFTASFGRPMHYKGKGKNAAAVHWQATKQTEFSFRSHQGNAEVHYQWRREL